MAAEGKAIAKVNDLVIFVPYVVPGDVVDLQIKRKKNKYAEAEAVKFHELSPNRAVPFCQHYGVCGGCKWQVLPYSEQIRYKQKQVEDNLRRIGKIELPEISPILGSDKTEFYRNKLEFTFSNKRWLTNEEVRQDVKYDQMNAVGFHIPGAFDKVLAIEKCWLQDDISNRIRNAVRDYAYEHDYSFINLRTQEGMLRNMIVRTSSTGELMVIVICKITEDHEMELFKKETFLFSNAGFVKQEDAEKFADWAKNQNFYGRWMPERRGMIEFLWNDYPWADVYKSSIEHEVWSRSHDCPCDMQLSYEAQLQEDWEGIGRENEFLSTAYMPCAEMMDQMGLYCSEIRGVIKATDGSVAALNTGHGNCINGLFVRRDILNDYLKRNGYVMFYYVLGEKVLRIGEMNSIMKDLSAAYQFQPEHEALVIQPMRIIERVALKKKNDEERLISHEMADTDFGELLKAISEDKNEDE